MAKQKQKPEKRAGPPAPVAAGKRRIQFTPKQTPKQLSAQLRKAETEEELNKALKSILNYIRSLSPEMTKGEYEQNRDLHKQLSKLSNARAEEGYYPKLVDRCIEELEDKLSRAKYKGPKTSEEAIASKEEKPMKFMFLWFMNNPAFAKTGSVGFGNLPSQMAQQLNSTDIAMVHNELNRLATAYFTNGNTKKAGNRFLRRMEQLFEGYGFNKEEISSAISNLLSETEGLGDEIKNALRNGTYGEYFFNDDASFSEWRRAGTDNYLAFTYKELELRFSSEVTKAFPLGKGFELGLRAHGQAYEETTTSVREGELGQMGDRESRTRWLGGGGAELYGEVEEGRWKAGASAGVAYVPGKQGGWFIPVTVMGQVGGGTDATSHTLRLQVEASPEVTGRAFNLEAGAMLNGLFYTKGKENAAGYLFGVRTIRMSQNMDGTTNVDLIIEGQLGPTFQKIIRDKAKNKETLIWAGVSAIVQQEIPQGRDMEGRPLPQQTGVGAGVQAGVKGEAEGFLQLQLNPIPVNNAVDFTGEGERGEFEGVMVNIGVKF
ncbi:MAG: hypothetical protein ACLFUZ_01875 [Candidatus Micrarchaeia archaeon]